MQLNVTSKQDKWTAPWWCHRWNRWIDNGTILLQQGSRLGRAVWHCRRCPAWYSPNMRSAAEQHRFWNQSPAEDTCYRPEGHHCVTQGISLWIDVESMSQRYVRWYWADGQQVNQQGRQSKGGLSLWAHHPVQPGIVPRHPGGYVHLPEWPWKFQLHTVPFLES